MADYAETLLQAMDQMIEAKTLSLNYDKTIVCTIKNVEHADDGEYTVTDGSTSFIAYSQNDTIYKNGDVVYVQIPQGNYNKQKWIIGKQTGTNSEQINYVAPFDSYFDITGNLWDVTNGDIKTGASLLANDPDPDTTENEYSLGQTNDKMGVIYHPLGIVSVDDGMGYERMGIQADFQSWIPTAITGNYGLEVRFITSDETTTNSATNEMSTHVIRLDSSDMYGNPYNFGTYFTQQLVYDISELGNITYIGLWFYQENNFYVDNNEKLSYFINEENKEKLIDNLFINNINISLGYPTYNEEKNILYTTNSLTYSQNSSTDANKKIVKVRWTHILDEEAQECVAITKLSDINKYFDLDKNDVYIHLYHYDKDATDTLAGAYWQEILDDNNKPWITLEKYTLATSNSFDSNETYYTYSNGKYEKDTESYNAAVEINKLKEQLADELTPIYDAMNTKIAEARANADKIVKGSATNEEVAIAEAAYEDSAKAAREEADAAAAPIINKYYEGTDGIDPGINELEKDYEPGKFYVQTYTYDDSKDRTFCYEFNPDVSTEEEYLKAIIEIVDRNGLIEYNETYESNLSTLNNELSNLQSELDNYNNLLTYYKNQNTVLNYETGAYEVTGAYDAVITDTENNIAVKQSEITAKNREIEKLKLDNSQYYTYLKSTTYNKRTSAWEPMITFYNEHDVANSDTKDLVTALGLTVQDGSNGKYHIYDTLTNDLINASEKNKERPLHMTFLSRFTQDNNADITQIRWYIPRGNTMISPLIEGKEYNLNSLTKDSSSTDTSLIFKDSNGNVVEKVDLIDDWYVITRNNPDLYISDSNANGIKYTYSSQYCTAIQYFKIQSHYLQTASNNTIRCVVVRADGDNRIENEKTLDLSFGNNGSNGTNNTLILSLGNETCTDMKYKYVMSLPTEGDANSFYLIKSLSYEEEIPFTSYSGAGAKTLWSHTAESDYVITSATCDVDTCVESTWTSYASPEVDLKIGSSGSYVIQSKKDNAYSSNGSDLNAVVKAGATFSLYSQGYNDDGQDITFLNNGKVAWQTVPLEDHVYYVYIYNSYTKEWTNTGTYRDVNNLIDESKGDQTITIESEEVNTYATAWTIGSTTSIELIAKLYDSSDNELDLTGSTVKWSFLKQNSKNVNPGGFKLNDYIAVDAVDNTAANYNKVTWYKYVAPHYELDSDVDYSSEKTYYEDTNGTVISVKSEDYLPDTYYVYVDEDYVVTSEWEDGATYYTKNSNILETSNKSNSYPCILQCDVWYRIPGDYNFVSRYTGYLPVATRSGRNVDNFEGADRVIYNSGGSSPTYYKSAYKINYGDISSAKMIYYDYKKKSTVEVTKDDDNYYFLPYIYNERYLRPRNMFFNDTCYCVWAQLESSSGTWNQPILIIQNPWGSSMLNDWDGSLQLNEDEGTIMASMIGAGTKSADNKFEGVLMGQVTKGTGDTSAGTGIFGYKDGVQAFGFKTNGKAFIGKAAKAQINFDGDKGTIMNKGYSEGTGIKISLDGDTAEKQSISIKNGGNEYIYLGSGTSDEESSTYLRVKGKNDNILLNIGEKKDGESSYYLQSYGYTDGDTSAGAKIDLSSGKLRLKANSDNEKNKGSIDINSGAGTYPFNINDTFKINWNGAFSASNNNFKVDESGNITASGGTIGGWTITSNKLYNGNTYLASSGETYNIYGAAIGGGSINIGNGNFTVDSSGNLYASNAEIHGAIYADSGELGSLTVTGTLTGGKISGASISGGSITGTTISASGYVTCSGLNVGGKNYAITETSIVTDLVVDTKSVVTVLSGSVDVGIITLDVSVDGGVLGTLYGTATATVGEKSVNFSGSYFSDIGYVVSSEKKNMAYLGTSPV